MYYPMALKVYLVFGGFTSTTGDPPVASTELLLHGDSSWTQVGSLPHSLYGLKAVSLNNDVIATGDNIYFLIGKIQNPMHFNAFNSFLVALNAQMKMVRLGYVM